MENYFQAMNADAAERVHKLTKEDDTRKHVAREQMAFMNIILARWWYDLHKKEVE